MIKISNDIRRKMQLLHYKHNHGIYHNLILTPADHNQSLFFRFLTEKSHIKEY